jgi:hypothetical protein
MTGRYRIGVRRRAGIGASLSLAAAASLWVAGAASAYTVLPLTSAAVRNVTEVAGIDGTGAVVGNAEFTGKPTLCSEPFIWRAGDFQRLADSACEHEEKDSAVGLLGIDEADEIFGERLTGGEGGDATYVWDTPLSTPEKLPDQPSSVAECGPPGDIEALHAISRDGDATGRWAEVSSGCMETGNGAFLLKHGAANAEGAVGDIDGSECERAPKETLDTGVSINDSDEIVVYAPCRDLSKIFCDRWASGTLTPLPAGACQLPGQPRGTMPINDSGVILSRTETDTGGVLSSVAEYVTRAGTVSTLTPLAGDNEAIPFSVNDSGDVVGTSWVKGDPAEEHATLWRAATPPATGTPPPPVDLNSLISPEAGITLHQAYEIASNGDILANATVNKTGTNEYVELVGGEGLSIAAGAPVDEPAATSVQQSFTVSLAESKTEPVSVQYETVDGTARSAAHEYTPTHGTLTFAPGETEKEIQVEVDDGSGVAETPDIGYQVVLKDPTGTTIETESASGVIVVPSISGHVTKPNGERDFSHTIELKGISSSGHALIRTVLTDEAGLYELYADPGSYEVMVEDGEGSTQIYEPSACPGAVADDACLEVSLAPGDNLTVDFKELDFVVDSASDAGVSKRAKELGFCDVSPSAEKEECTLRAALEVSESDPSDHSIGFDIPGAGVPVIEAGSVLADRTASIYGDTQPGGSVDIRPVSGKTAGVGLSVEGNGLTVQGLNMEGFAVDMVLGEFPRAEGPGALPLPSSANLELEQPLSAPIESPSAGGFSDDRIEGDVFGKVYGNIALAGERAATPEEVDEGSTPHIDVGGVGLLALNPLRARIGGSAPHAGDVFHSSLFAIRADALVLEDATMDHETGAYLEGGQLNTIGAASGEGGNQIGHLKLDGEASDVVQGNRITTGLEILGGKHTTVGGVSRDAGSQPGNELEDVGDNGQGLTVTQSAGDVIQGNLISTKSVGLRVKESSHLTVGGAGGAANEFLGRDSSEATGVRFENTFNSSPGAASSDDVIADNRMSGMPRGVAIDGSNTDERADEEIKQITIEGNEMQVTGPGIVFGSEYLFNTIASAKMQAGPNSLQPYPVLIAASETAHRTKVALKLDAPPGTYTVELYSQPKCAKDDLTPGEGFKALGVQTVKVGTFEREYGLTFGAAAGAVAMTATSAAGSTSEISPCLTIGHRAASFAHEGVIITEGVSPVRSPPASSSRVTRAGEARAHARVVQRPAATLALACPPNTIDYCRGTAVLTLDGRNGSKIGRASFDLAPGQLATLSVPLSSRAALLLARHRRLETQLTIDARDGRRRSGSRRTHRAIRLQLL